MKLWRYYNSRVQWVRALAGQQLVLAPFQCIFWANYLETRASTGWNETLISLHLASWFYGGENSLTQQHWYCIVVPSFPSNWCTDNTFLGPTISTRNHHTIRIYPTHWSPLFQISGLGQSGSWERDDFLSSAMTLSEPIWPSQKSRTIRTAELTNEHRVPPRPGRNRRFAQKSYITDCRRDTNRVPNDTNRVSVFLRFPKK